MFKNVIILPIILICISGCKISPLSPNNRINNQNGTIQELKNNQNGLMLDLIEIEQKQKLIIDQLETLQQGLINQNNKNFGIQIFHGDGGLLIGLAIVSLLVYGVVHYKTQANKNQKAAELIAKEVKLKNDEDLNNKIYASALETTVGEEVYRLMN